MTSRRDGANRPATLLVQPDALLPNVPDAGVGACQRAMRLAELQQRVREGTYDDRSGMEQVAQRILARGDL